MDNNGAPVDETGEPRRAVGARFAVVSRELAKPPRSASVSGRIANFDFCGVCICRMESSVGTARLTAVGLMPGRFGMNQTLFQNGFANNAKCRLRLANSFR